MASRSLGTLTLDLVAKTGAFVQGMTAAERAAQKSLSAIEKRAYAFGQALGTGLKIAGVAAAAALVAVTKAAIDNADALRDSSIQLGISTETLSAYGYAAQQTGTDLDGLSRGLKILSKNAADAVKPTSEQAKIFDALGIAVTDSTGTLRKLDDLIPEIADAFKAMEDGTQKAALAQALFGKSGLELTEFLNSGSQGLKEFTERAEALGIVVGTDTANAADEFNDKLADLRAQVAGFGNQLAAELLPRLIELIDYFSESQQRGELLGVTVKQLGELFDFLFVELKKADEVGRSFTTTMGGIASYIGLVKQAFSDLLSLNISGFFTNSVNAVKQAYSNLKASFGDFSGVADFSGVTSRVIGATSRNARGGSNRPETGGKAIDTAALSRALGGISDPKTSAGVKKVTKEVDTLTESYNRLIASLAERTALIGKEGEAAKVSYDIQFGELSKLSQAQKDVALAAAQKYDAEVKAYELAEDARRQQERDLEFAQRTLEDLQFETELLGKTREEQEKLTLARRLGGIAATEQGQAAIAALESYQQAATQMEDNIELTDGLRDATRGFLDDLREGASLWDAMKDAFDRFADAIFDWASKKVIEQLFGQMGSASGSGGGFDWLSLFSAFTGGPQITGFATGGKTSPWSVSRVNERGFEMATVGGNDYMLTGSRPVEITPNHKLGGGGFTQNLSVVIAGRPDRRTPQQIAREAGRESTRAMARNGR